MRFVVLGLAVALAAAGCATPYQPAGFAGGFTESWRAKNLVVIDFKGNGFTSAEQIGEMTLLRAAELAQAHEYGYFRITDEADTTTSMFVPGTTTTTGRVNPNGTFTARSRDNSFTAIKPGAKTYVVMVKYRDADDPSIYDAAEVIARLSPKYKG